MNRQELLQYIRNEVEYIENCSKNLKYDTGLAHSRGAIEAYLDIYNKLISAGEVTELDKAWANKVLNNLEV